MNEKTIALLSKVTQLFMRFGIKSLTMDDIARKLKISKKTLYKHVSDKNDLVAKAMGLYCDKECIDIEEIVKGTENAIDEIIKVTKHVTSQLQTIHPSIHYDMEKYYPEAWEIFNKHKSEFVFQCIYQNLERGKEEGYFRKNLHSPIIARIFIERMDVTFDSEVFPADEYKFDEVYLEMMRYHIRGIANEKGIELLTETLHKEKISL